jgi:atypical dual specificity phosphatase
LFLPGVLLRILALALLSRRVRKRIKSFVGRKVTAFSPSSMQAGGAGFTGGGVIFTQNYGGGGAWRGAAPQAAPLRDDELKPAEGREVESDFSALPDAGGAENGTPKRTMNRFFARLFFYPTLYWNILINRVLKLRAWWNWIDETVLLGALPVASDAPAFQKMGITGVINMCEEYPGPLAAYTQHGIEQLHLPTIDFVPPSDADVRRGVDFIEAHRARGGKVYVHCKAGRGRSATVVLCYLIARGHSLEGGAQLMREKRPQILSKLAEREVIKRFALACANASESPKVPSAQ